MLPMPTSVPETTTEASAPGEPRTFLVPHTHWDREWYQPFDEFLQRLVEMMDGLIEVLSNDERFGHFHLDGQTAMIDDYLAVRPERRPDVERLAREGRLSVGPWFTQMDEFLTSGESTIRNLEWGTRRAAELTGEAGGGLRAGYLPDQFGHIGQMPQILANAGFERAVVWRGVPNEIDRTAFHWESPDGSRVLAEYLIWGYSLGLGIGWALDADGIGIELRKAIDWIAPHAAYPDRVLVEVGSDHQGPAAKLPPLLGEVNAAIGARAEIGSIASYLDAPEPEGISTWRGELRSAARTYLLPGVYSTRAHQKEKRAEVETILERWAEPFAALVPGFEWPAAELEEAWRLLLWNGAHDSVCGCSVDRVAADVDARYAQAESLAENILLESRPENIVYGALAQLADRMASRGWMYVNPSPFERHGVPGLGWLVIPDDETGPPWRPPQHPPVRFPQLPLQIEGDEIIAGGFRLWLVDEGDVGDLYNFCPTEDAPPRRAELAPGERGAVVATFPGVRLELRAELQEEAVMIGGPLRNENPDHRVRLHVALDIPADGSVALAPFEVVERGPRSEGGTEPPSPTWPARGAVSAGGVSVFQRGVFEYEVIEDSPALAVTLLRCVGTISRPGFDTRGGPAGPDIPTPDGQMIGDHAVLLSIQGGVTAGALPAAWEERMLLLRSARAKGGGDLPDRGSLLEIDGAELSSVRRVDDGSIEVRLWNPSMEPRTARVGDREIPLGPARIETVRLT
jgi:alpha-mannosidase